MRWEYQLYQWWCGITTCKERIDVCIHGGCLCHTLDTLISNSLWWYHCLLLRQAIPITNQSFSRNIAIVYINNSNIWKQIWGLKIKHESWNQSYFRTKGMPEFVWTLLCPFEKATSYTTLMFISLWSVQCTIKHVRTHFSELGPLFWKNRYTIRKGTRTFITKNTVGLQWWRTKNEEEQYLEWNNGRYPSP